MRTDTAPLVKLADYEPFPFAIETAALRFDLHTEKTLVEAELNIRRTGSAGAPLRLDGEKLTLKSVEIDGTALAEEDYTRSDDALEIPNAPDSFTLKTVVEINPSQNTELSGLYMSGGRFCSQCEAQGFRRITYWPDRPDVMSRFSVWMAAEKKTYPILLSNGEQGTSGDLEDGRHFAEWDDPHLKPSYLFALCAGDYDVFRDTFETMSGKPVDLAIHVDKGEAEKAAWAMESLKNSMRWDEQVFGREYDLPVFNIVAVRDFNFGAMENKGLNIFNSAYVLANEETATDMDFEAIESIVGHEYFHNWTGNRITCRDWFQLCLKEGLTVFRDQEFSADMRSRPVQRIKDVIRLRARQFAEDAGPLAHPVRPDTYASIDNLYTATVYEKGAELIRSLKALIGEDAFAAGMNIYFDRHDGDAATIEDFYACFETATGRDLSDFRLWYAQAGTPKVTVTETWDNKTGRLTIALTQATPATPGQDSKEPVPIPLACALLDGKGGHVSAPGWEKGEKLIVLDKLAAVMDVQLTPDADRPMLSVNRGFSAPVDIVRNQTDADLTEAVAAETDPFNRWDGLHTLATNEILRLAGEASAEPDAQLIGVIAGAVLKAAEDDPAYAALLLKLPDVGALIQRSDPADPVALDAARRAMKTSLAARLSDWTDALLETDEPSPFKPDAEQAGIRALRAAAIDLRSLREDAGPVLKSVFERARTMTESLAALRALCTLHDAPERALALEAFRARWKDNPLVMDKWFAVQAASGDAAAAEALMQHPDYDAGNPNRVRSVIGVFAAQSLAHFHAPDGSGHALLARTAKAADTRNAALAARLLTLFDQWRRLEPKARASSEKALQALQSSGLSKNSTDIVTRTLG